MRELMFLFRASEAARCEAMSTPERAHQAMQAWLSWMRELEAAAPVSRQAARGVHVMLRA